MRKENLKMNVLIAINENYVRQAEMMLYSFSKHNFSKGGEKLRVYLLYSDISENALREFQFFLKDKCSIELISIRVDAEWVRQLPVLEYLTHETYFRLLAGKLLPDTVERVLWLDADMIIKGDCSALYHMDFQDNYLIACEDMLVGGNHLTEFHKTPNQQTKYFNAGMILFNLRKIRADKKEEEVLRFLTENRKPLKFLDQDVLNIVYYGKVRYVDPKKYNHLMLTVEKVNKTKKALLEKNTVIIHYVGADKPWFYKYVNPSWKYYWQMELENGNYFGYVKFLIQHYVYLFVRKIYQAIGNGRAGIL